MPDLFDDGAHRRAEQTIAALQEEIDIRDDAHEQCLADLEWCAQTLARIVRDGVPEWSRASFHEVLNRINRNI
jgi:hypothetical protein